jgi:hypothetical protein
MRYKLLFLDRRHHVLNLFEFQAPDDSEAEGAAEDLNGTTPRELWCGPRLIKSWPDDQVQDAR